MPAFESKTFDVGTDRFGDPQPIQRQQADERMITRTPEPGRDQQRTHLVAVQTRGTRFVIEARSAHMHRR